MQLIKEARKSLVILWYTPQNQIQIFNAPILPHAKLNGREGLGGSSAYHVVALFRDSMFLMCQRVHSDGRRDLQMMLWGTGCKGFLVGL